MKRTLYILFHLFLIQLVFTSCSEEWFEQADTTDSMGEEQLFASPEEAEFLVDGIAHLMYTPYKTDGTANKWNGEGSIMYYSTVMGQNALCVNNDAYSAVVRGSITMLNPNSIYDYYPWGYYYRLISNANLLINGIEQYSDTSGCSGRYNFLKAQGLTFRAFAYFRLSQLYCHRWNDAGAPQSKGLPLRLNPNDLSSKESSTLQETIDQILEDLQNADSLYATTKESRGNKYWQPDANVNNAIWARVCLHIGQYDEAVSHASKARSGYSLMSASTYRSGFNSRTTETIWGNPGTSSGSQLDEASFFSQHMAYDRSYYLDYPICISKELYKEIPSTDVRHGIFLDPGNETYETKGAMLGYVDQDSALYSRTMDKYPDLNGSIYAYMNFKFKCADENHLGEGVLNFCRVSEMYLIEAEAYYEAGKEKEAVQFLRLLNQSRNSSWTLPQMADTIWLGYSIIMPDGSIQEAYKLSWKSITGTALRDEIRKWRSIELWGEGFDWFDQKRWALPIEHHGYPEGNFYASMVYYTDPMEFNGWTWVYPNLETDYQ